MITIHKIVTVRPPHKYNMQAYAKEAREKQDKATEILKAEVKRKTLRLWGRE